MWFLIILSSLELASGQSCYQGWVRERDTCYKARLTSLPWQRASDDCHSMHADLVTLNDLTEQTRILELRPENVDAMFWIGFHKMGAAWRWPGRKNTTFSQLDTQNKSFTGDCAAIDKKGAWLPTSCDTKLPFFCQAASIDCPQDEGWLVDGSRCLLVVNVSESWLKARGHCRTLHADLAVLGGRISYPRLTQTLKPHGHVWIGITLDSIEGKYKWLDGNDVTGTVLNKFNSSVCGAVTLNTSGQIQVNDQSCSSKLISVCEKSDVKASIHVSSSAAATMARAPAVSTLSSTVTSERPSEARTSTIKNWLDNVLKCVHGGNSTHLLDCFNDALRRTRSILESSWNALDIYNVSLQLPDSNTVLQDLAEAIEMLHGISSVVMWESPLGSVTELGQADKVFLMAKRIEHIHVSRHEIAMPGCLVTNISLLTDGKKGANVLLTAMLVAVVPYKVVFDNSEGNCDYYVVSPVLSLSGYDGATPVSMGHTFTLFHPQKQDMVNTLKRNRTAMGIICGFYDAKKGLWSDRGCTIARAEQYTTTCVCTHTTSFAVLMKVTSYELERGDEVALSIITSIGCSISMLTMFIALTIFTCIRSLNSERVYVHRNLCLAILCAQVAFLAGIKATEHKVVCRIAAIVLHYCYTAVFTWMFVEGLHLYTKVVQVFGTENTRTTYYLCFGWGIPLLLVTISAVADIEGYGSSSSCWLSIYRKTIWAFVGPAVAVITVNVGILIMVLKIVIGSTRIDQPRHSDQVRAGVKGAAILLPLLGLTWLFGLLAINKDLILFEYMFALFNSLQGFFIFLFHCLLNTEVRESLKRVREQRALRNGTSVTSSYTDTFDGSSTTPPTGAIQIKAGVRLYLPVNVTPGGSGSKQTEPLRSTAITASYKTSSENVILSTQIKTSDKAVEDSMTLVYI